jgi:hypothetical protein
VLKRRIRSYSFFPTPSRYYHQSRHKIFMPRPTTHKHASSIITIIARQRVMKKSFNYSGMMMIWIWHRHRMLVSELGVGYGGISVTLSNNQDWYRRSWQPFNSYHIYISVIPCSIQSSTQMFGCCNRETLDETSMTLLLTRLLATDSIIPL